MVYDCVKRLYEELKEFADKRAHLVYGESWYRKWLEIYITIEPPEEVEDET